MNVRKLLLKIAETISIILHERNNLTDAELEKLLDNLKYRLLKERPLKLQNQN